MLLADYKIKINVPDGDFEKLADLISDLPDLRTAIEDSAKVCVMALSNATDRPLKFEEIEVVTE